MVAETNLFTFPYTLQARRLSRAVRLTPYLNYNYGAVTSVNVERRLVRKHTHEHRRRRISNYHVISTNDRHAVRRHVIILQVSSNRQGIQYLTTRNFGRQLLVFTSGSNNLGNVDLVTSRVLGATTFNRTSNGPSRKLNQRTKRQDINNVTVNNLKVIRRSGGTTIRAYFNRNFSAVPTQFRYLRHLGDNFPINTGTRGRRRHNRNINGRI